MFLQKINFYVYEYVFMYVCNQKKALNLLE